MADRFETDEQIEGALKRHADEVRVSGNVGLNSDWNVSAWAVTPGRANRTQGMLYVLDDERGQLELVQRYYAEGPEADALEQSSVDVDFEEGRYSKIDTVMIVDATDRGVQEIISAVEDYLRSHSRKGGVWPPHLKGALESSAVEGDRLVEQAKGLVDG